jgi:hypothetical protein
MKPSFSMKWLFLGTAAVALAVAALLNANWWWNASLQSLFNCLLIASLILGIWGKKPFFGGFAVAGLVHVLVLPNESLNLISDGFTNCCTF